MHSSVAAMEDTDSDSDYNTNRDSASRSINASKPLLPARTLQSSTGAGTASSVPRTDRARCANGCSKGYVIRHLKSRAAVLVLLWNLLVFSYQYESLRSILKIFPSKPLKEPWVATCLTLLFQESIPHLFYPLAGWLADAKFGRYKVMRASLWLMWFGSVVLLLVLIIHYTSTYTYSPAHGATIAVQLVLVAVYIVNSIGLAGFHANVIPFGLDQMEGGSSDQFSAFIHWYYWSRNFSIGLFIRGTLYAAFVCGEEEGEEDYHKPENRIDLVILAVEVGFLSLALVLDFLFSDWLVKEPRTQNPLKTIWKVSCFVVQHNQPVGRRSAFSYAALSRSRSDLGKKLYGGPFESEDVEDVKTFWNVIVLLFSLGGGTIMIQAAGYSYSLFAYHTQWSQSISNHEYIEHCKFQSFITLIVPPLVVAFLIVIYEFIVYPLFSNYTLRMLKRMALGMLISLCGIIVLLIQNGVAHYQYHYAKCMFYSAMPDWDQRYHMHMAWLILPIALMGFGEFLLYITAFEFICAQSPYAMRGLLIGTYYFVGGVFIALTALLLLVIAKAFEHHQIVTHHLSCGSSYYLVVLVVGLLGMILYSVVAVWYRKRHRGGQEFINERAILESYYEHAIRSH